ncbi:Protein Fe65 [Portunus trituberculatus]|uniref:Protein Fe65 n=1 Tax=Portunus trituberculatus TaxID=210409 RepID=A0A5B7J8R1_PORTR|nr:Protein Fe65 [Portunus trituberculatus]
MISTQSFPTPMEEPKKVMRVQYVGLLQVERPSGMEVLNTAIDRVVEANPPPWRNVSVAVAPSTVTITNTDDGKQIAECRVRFLSFLGIGHDVKHCAFIMHTAQDQFIAYVFFCEPSTGALCKTIEAACKCRRGKGRGYRAEWRVRKGKREGKIWPREDVRGEKGKWRWGDYRSISHYIGYVPPPPPPPPPLLLSSVVLQPSHPPQTNNCMNKSRTFAA